MRAEARRELARQRAELSRARSHAAQSLDAAARVRADARVGEALRRDLDGDALRLREVLEGDDAQALRARAAPVDARIGLVYSALSKDGLVASFEVEVGPDLSRTLRRQVAAQRAATQRALAGSDWDELGRATALLTHFQEHTLHEVTTCWQPKRAVRSLAARTGAELRREADALLRPVSTAAAKAATWDEVLAACRALPPAARQPRRLRDLLEQGKAYLRDLEPSERPGLQAAIDDAERALHGPSWAHALAAAERIRPAAVGIFRDELAIEPAPCLRILSIDGGGVRGVIPATMLVEIERRTGKPISRLFDYVIGTSAGGILALGLTVPDPASPRMPRYTAEALARTFEDDAAQIFPSLPLLSTVRQALVPKYSPRGLERVLERYFGDALLADALTNVFVISYSLEERLHTAFGNFDDGAMQMREAARATSAAPTYFAPLRIAMPKRPLKTHEAPDPAKPPQEIDLITMVDGGVFANNPTPFALSTLIALEGTSSAYAPRTRPWLVVSLGTGQTPPSPAYGDVGYGGLLGWGMPLVDIMFANPGVDANRMLQPSDRYFRFQPRTLSEATASLDNGSRANIDALKEVARRYLETRDAEEELRRLAALLARPRPAECPRVLGQP